MPDKTPAPENDPAWSSPSEYPFPFEYRPPDEADLRWHAVRSLRRGGIFLVAAAAGLVGLHLLAMPWWVLVLAFLSAAVAYQPLGRRFALADHLRWIRSRAKVWERERSGGTPEGGANG